jgi:hypothetical protein
MTPVQTCAPPVIKTAPSRHSSYRPQPKVAGRTSDDRVPNQSPAISLFLAEGCFIVEADFSMVAGSNPVTVEFAQQGILFNGGAVQRYIPIPTESDVERASVILDGRIARVSVPTAELGTRWRTIGMW